MIKAIDFSSLLLLFLIISIGVAPLDSGAEVHKSIYGSMPDGTQIELYTLGNAHGLEAKIITYGATLISVRTPDRQGNFDNITLHLDALGDYLKGHPLFGSTVGRFANRIGGAKFTIDGITYPITPNAGKNHIHGGKNSFHKLVWKASPVADGSINGVDFTHISPDGTEGYPGTLKVTARYELTNDNKLILKYMAETDKPTVLTLTNHVYWNLGGAGSGDVLDHQLALYSDRYLAYDQDKIPTGEFLPVKNTAMDFTSSMSIGSRIDKVSGQNYDHCYVVRHKEGQALSHIATAHNKTSGRTMEVYTTQPGVQLYTAKHLSDRYKAGGKSYAPYHGFCLETQNFPNAPNIPDFPSSVLRPKEKYEHSTIYQFKIQK
jgi:aldose 1-epimerase